MAILRKSTKLSDSNTLKLSSEILFNNVGCFEIAPEGTPAYNPDVKKVEPVVEEEKIDHRPKDWYDQQCKLENFVKGIVLNSSSLNNPKRSEDV